MMLLCVCVCVCVCVCCVVTSSYLTCVSLFNSTSVIRVTGLPPHPLSLSVYSLSLPLSPLSLPLSLSPSPSLPPSLPLSPSLPPSLSPSLPPSLPLSLSLCLLPPSLSPSLPPSPSLPLSLSLPQREPSGELAVERALSDRWVYHQHWHNWERRTHHRCHSDSSEGGNLADSSLPAPPSNLVVSELRGSLTDLTREVKTYSFCPADDGEVPPIVVDPPGTTHYASTSSPSPTKPYFPRPSSPGLDDEVLVMRENGEDVGMGGGGVRLSGHSVDSEADSEIFDPHPDISDKQEEEQEDSFASGLCNVFDNSLQKLRSFDQRSHSLPNVFSLGHDIIDTSCVSTTTDENTSTSVSVTSVLGDSATALDEPVIEPASTPERLFSTSSAVSVNGLGGGAKVHRAGRTSSSTTLPPSFKMFSSPARAGGGRGFAMGGVVIPKRWSGNDGMGGYDSGSEVGEGERGRVSPAGERGGWMSISYAHPPRQRSPGSPEEGGREGDRVQRRKKRTSGRHRYVHTHRCIHTYIHM